MPKIKPMQSPDSPLGACERDQELEKEKLMGDPEILKHYHSPVLRRASQ